MSIDPTRVKRYAHGSRVPGWDSSVDLTKDPAVVPDPATTYVPAHVRTAIEDLMTKYPDIRSAAIPSMKVVQSEHGWLSPTAMEQAACVMRLTPAYLVSVASFYDMFELSPKGANDVYVCTNISCSLLGADELYAHVKDVLGGDPDFNVRALRVPRRLRDRPDGLGQRRLRRPAGQGRHRAAARRRQGRPRGPRGQATRQAQGRLQALAGTPVIANIDTILFKDIDEPGLNTLDVYAKRGGYEMLKKALKMEPGAVLDEMLASGVRGRGGAGFAMGRKMSFIPKGTMDKYLVCNADESEPGTFKDRELMQKNPHLLIEGIIIGAYCIGASRSFIFIRGEYDYVADILDAAVAEARAAGFIGENVLGSDHTIDLVVHRGAGAYICGEETALLDSLEGKRGNPRLKPPFPAVQGLYQGPTLINNVETLMNVPVILGMGGAEYAKIGTETSTGTKLISISGQIKYPGNYEIVLGTKVPRHPLRPRRRPARGQHVQGLVPRRFELSRCSR